MEKESMTGCQEDAIVALLRSQISSLTNILHHIEGRNRLNGYVDETLRRVEKELHWLRTDVLSND